MALKELGLDTLHELDFGKVEKAFRAHLKRIGYDCADRPGNQKARTVVLSVSIVPATNDDGTADRAKVQMTVTSSVPKHTTAVYDMGLRATGQLAFNEDDAQAFDQPALPFSAAEQDDEDDEL